jgi:hypothetical protein
MNKIEIMDAEANGSIIERLVKAEKGMWEIDRDPMWNWELYDYRVRNKYSNIDQIIFTRPALEQALKNNHKASADLESYLVDQEIYIKNLQERLDSVTTIANATAKTKYNTDKLVLTGILEKALKDLKRSNDSFKVIS